MPSQASSLKFLLLSSLLTLLQTINAAPTTAVPTCQTGAAPSQTPLTAVRTTNITVPPFPFGITYATEQKHTVFVSFPRALGVLDTSTSPPTLSHQIALPAAYTAGAGAEGITLTPSGKHVLVCGYVGAVIIDAAKAAAGDSDAVVGTLNGTFNGGVEAIEATVTADGKYAFISQEYGSNATDNRGTIEVFHLQHESSSSPIATYIGRLVLNQLVVGTALSPDGRTLYATSETVTNNTGEGTLSVIDVATLTTHPAKALLTSVPAGCGAVRVIASADGHTVWVTARESNALLAFDAKKLRGAHPAQAFLASVEVGTSPVGLTFVKNQTRILTADSNRFNFPGAVTGLSVVDVEAVLGKNGKNPANAVLGTIPTGLFPREFAVSPDRETVLVTDHNSKQVQEVDVRSLP